MNFTHVFSVFYSVILRTSRVMFSIFILKNHPVSIILLYRTLGRPQCLSVCFREEKILLPLERIEPRLVQPI